MRRAAAVESAVLACALMLFSGCESNAGPIDPELNAFDVRTVEVTPQIDTIFAADTVRPTDRLQLTASIKGIGGKPIEGARAVWYSEDSTLADVSESGVVRPFKYGTVRIVASAAKKGYATVVIAPAVTRVTVTPLLDTVLVRDPIVAGDTIRLRAVSRDTDGIIVTGTRTTWSSGTVTIATVDSTGLVRVLTPGVVQITARSAGAVGVATIVAASTYKSVSVTAPVMRGLAFDTVQLVGVARNYSDAPVAGATLTWRTSNAAVATVSSTGEVRSVAPGTVTISASGNFRSSDVTLTFLERRLLNVQAGGEFSCGTALLGRLYCWGSNASGQLATTADSTCFDDINRRIDLRIGCALEPKRQAGTPIEFVAVATGGSFACGLSQVQQIYCWGSDDSGQIGNGSRGGGVQPTLATVLGLSFTAITAGRRHACALTSAGRRAYCWGADSSGQLGDRRFTNSTTPIPVSTPLAFRSISAGGEHTCGIAESGGAYCWGANNRGQLGTGNAGGNIDHPVPVQNGQTFVGISAGYLHTCAIDPAGRAFCWGDNERAQLGSGDASAPFASVPTPVAGSMTFANISAGQFFPVLTLPNENRSSTCALTANGDVYCWGDNYWRQAGSENGEIVPTPNLMASGTSSGFRTISTGSRHSCAFGNDGNAWCWGSNVFGALGNGLQAAGRHVPQQVMRPR